MNLNDLISNLPVSDLAAKFGVDENIVSGALQQAVPGILSGMAVNASTEEGAQKLADATKKHADASIAVSDIDVEDGKKIVKKVLGDKESDVAAALGAKAGNADIAGLIPKILPVIAPMLMQFLGGKQSSSSGGGITDLLGGLLGGGSSSAGGGIGDLLGGILGGGNIGDLLGGKK